MRLAWYDFSLKGKQGRSARRTDWKSLGIWAFLWIVLHILAFMVLEQAPDTAAPLVALRPAITATLLATFLFMLSSALKASVEVLYERGDLDLLLSSPLPSRSIFATRLAAVVVRVSALYLFFLAPFANAGALLGGVRWLAIYPTLAATAALAASTAMLATLMLLRLLGARRTRILAQVLGAVAGAALFLLSQAWALADRSGVDGAGSWPGSLLERASSVAPDSAVWLPARAAMGEAGALLGLSLLATVVAGLTVSTLHKAFVEGLTDTASTARVRKPVRASYRFGRPLGLAVLAKEWRLILRDTHLLSQVLLQLLYMLPLGFLLLTSGESALPGLGAGLTILCGSLASSLAWIIVLAEEAPDLIGSSPASGHAVRRAKLAASALPPLVLASPVLVWLLVMNPVSGAIVCFTATGTVVGGSLVPAWSGRAVRRDEFKSRGKRNLMSNLLEASSLFAWGGVAFLLLRLASRHPLSGPSTAGAAALVMLAVSIPLLAWLTRGRRH